MSLSATINYIWDQRTDHLGKGATGNVWKARNKKTGLEVAVKVVNSLPTCYAHVIPHRREVEVMRQLKHENIVQFITLEKELATGKDVLVIELCKGGSLLEHLNKPQNALGLTEEEFLLVFTHVGNGLCYLREMGIVHRDLKPPNIMRYIADDGSSVYKLTDFGTARELRDEEQFASLCGTEEYLHPHMFAVALMHIANEKMFTAQVDLWSLGVTLYHVSTGNLPFKPYGGRKNRETMYAILSKKEVGVISGVQKVHNGEIVWSTSLPETCHLSRGLQEYLLPLIAGLLELDPKFRWSFNQFFAAVQQVSSSSVIHVYNVTQMELLYIYLPVDGSLNERISRQTGISAQDQILLYEGEQYTNTTCHPFTTREKPLFLLSASARQLPTFNIDFQFPTLDEKNDLAADHAITELYRKSSANLESHVRDVVLKLELSDVALRMFIQVTRRETEAYLRITSEVRHSIQNTLKLSQGFLTGEVNAHRMWLEHLLTANPQSHETIQAHMKHMRDCVDSIECACKELSHRGIETWTTSSFCLETAWTRIDVRPAQQWLKIVAVRRQKIDEFHQLMKPHRDKSRLPYNEQCIYKFERAQMEEHSTTLLDVANECFNKEVPRILEQTAQATKSVMAVRASMMDEKVTLNFVREALSKLTHLLDQTRVKWSSEIAGLLQLVQGDPETDTSSVRLLPMVNGCPAVRDLSLVSGCQSLRDLPEVGDCPSVRDRPAVNDCQSVRNIPSVNDRPLVLPATIDYPSVKHLQEVSDSLSTGEQKQKLLHRLCASVRLFEEQSNKLHLGRVVEETHQLVHQFQRTAAYLLAPEALSEMSTNTYDSLISNAFVSLCVSDASSSLDHLPVQSVTNAPCGAVVNTGNFTDNLNPKMT